MKYIYLFLWKLLASLYYVLCAELFWPITKFIAFKVLKSKRKFKKDFKYLDDAQLSFPSGGIDWYASGLLYFIQLIIFTVLPLVIFDLRANKIDEDLKIYTIYFITTAVLFLILIIYNLYYKNKDWLKKEIGKARHKYSLSEAVKE